MEEERPHCSLLSTPIRALVYRRISQVMIRSIECVILLVPLIPPLTCRVSVLHSFPLFFSRFSSLLFFVCRPRSIDSFLQPQPTSDYSQHVQLCTHYKTRECVQTAHGKME